MKLGMSGKEIYCWWLGNEAPHCLGCGLGFDTGLAGNLDETLSFLEIGNAEEH